MLITSVVSDYVSELQPPRLFISQVIKVHGEPWWNNDREEVLIRPPERPLAILPVEPSSSNAEGAGEGDVEFGITKYLCSYFEVFLNLP
jgi:hypothetical protein